MSEEKIMSIAGVEELVANIADLRRQLERMPCGHVRADLQFDAICASYYMPINGVCRSCRQLKQVQYENEELRGLLLQALDGIQRTMDDAATAEWERSTRAALEKGRAGR